MVQERSRLPKSHGERPITKDRGKISFNGFMKKIKISQEKVLKKSKRIKVGEKGNMRIAAAEWVDEELIDNIKIRGKLSRRWRIARKKKKPKNYLANIKKSINVNR